MSYREIFHYRVRRNPYRTYVYLRNVEGDDDLILGSAEEIDFILDLLRNEKPLFYDRETRVFSTAEEIAGE